MKTPVLAFDPGRTTGYTQILVDDLCEKFEVVESFEIGWDDRFDILMSIFSSAAVAKGGIVVMESFHLFPDKATAQIGSNFPSSQVIGAIDTFCYLLNLPQSRRASHTSGQITRVAVLDEHLKYVAGSPHQIDAYKHARLYFLEQMYIPF